MSESSIQRSSLLLILTLAILLLVPWLGSKEFYSRGEAREALVAQRMLITSNYVLPESYNGAVPSKPPVLHWFIAGLSKMFGSVTEFSSRLPSAIGGVLFLLCFEVFLRRRNFCSWLAPLILLTSVEWFRGATTARVDGLLGVFFAGGLLSLYSWYEREWRGIPWSAILLLGLATLTKGPVGCVLPLAAFGLFLLTSGISIKRAALSCSAIGIPVLCIASVWYVLAYQHGGEKFWDKFYYENIARFSGTMDDEPHKHTIFYLYGTLLTGFIPWIGVLVATLLATRKRLFFAPLLTYFKSNSFARFCGVVSFTIICFFSIPSSKRSTYLLPAYPFLAFLFAEFFLWGLLIAKKSINIFIRIWILFVLLFLGVIGGLSLSRLAIGSGGTAVFVDSVRSFVVENQFLFIIGLIGCFLVMLYLLVKSFSNNEQEDRWVLRLSFGAFFVPFLISQALFINPIAKALSYKSFSDQTAQLVTHDNALYSFDDEFYGLSFYLEKPFISLTSASNSPSGGHVYLFEDNLETFRKTLRSDQSIEVLSRSQYSVVKPGAHVLLVSVSQSDQ